LRFHCKTLAHNNFASSSTITNILLTQMLTFQHKFNYKKYSFPNPVRGAAGSLAEFNQPASEEDRVNICKSIWCVNEISNGRAGKDLVMSINLP
ncbi:expressed protein, partial [Phakopsora pachyrhizi]